MSLQSKSLRGASKLFVTGNFHTGPEAREAFTECFGIVIRVGGGRPVEVAVSDVALSSDAGLLPVRPFDEKLGWNRRFADGLVDERDGAGASHVGESADALSFREREPHLRPEATA